MKYGIFAGVAAAVLGLFIAFGFINNNNYAVAAERQIEATATNNEQILSQFYQRLSETVQVTDIYQEDFKDSMTAMLAGRYGDGGSQASFQWIQESMPTLDPSMYGKVQQLIEIDRNRFQDEQQKLIDHRRQYQTKLGQFPSGVYLSFLGFPKIDMEDPRYNAVKTAEVAVVFETGEESKQDISALMGRD